jgi:hypothetical protein
MKIASVFLLLIAASFASAAPATTPSPADQLNQIKQLFDMGVLKLTMKPNCTNPGYSCQSSGDCCGSSFCDNGICSGADCQPLGAPCSNGGECCGSMYCDNDNRCDDASSNCYPSGSVCESSGECCGSSFCDNGICS